MMILALAMIPLLIVPLMVTVSPAVDRALVAVDYLIWAAFTIEYAVKLYLAPDRWRFVKANVPDLVIVVVPMLRPLRILRGVRLLRLLRLARLVAFAVEGLSEVRALLRRRGLSWVLLMVSGIALLGVITASIAAYFVEQKTEEDDVASRLDRILERLDAIESRLPVEEREPRSHDTAGVRR